MGDRRPENGRAGSTLHLDVVGVAAGARQQAAVLHPVHTLADCELDHVAVSACAMLLGLRRALAWCREPRSHARSEEHTSELQSLMRISYAVFCFKKTLIHPTKHHTRLHIQRQH